MRMISEFYLKQITFARNQENVERNKSNTGIMEKDAE